MSIDELLRAQNWERTMAQLTVYAFKRTRRRSWELARDLSQEAIAQAFERGERGWDPAKGSLMTYLATLVIGLSANESRRKRHKLDVMLDDDELSALPDRGAGLEREVERRLFTERLTARLSTQFAKDREVTMVLTLMVEGVDTPRDQAAATALPIEAIRRARRRLFDGAEKIAHELGEEVPHDQQA